MSVKFKLAFVGCGGRGRAHATGVRADARCRVVAAVDVNRPAAEKLVADFGFDSAEIYDDVGAMLAAGKPDVVVISLWTPLHLPVFRQCAEAGVRAVLCEKPMAPTWGECLGMHHIATRHKCQLTFSHQRRFSLGNRLVRQVIAEGRLGKLQRMDLYSPQNLLDCGTHTIDQAMSFNSELPAKWVLAAIDMSELIKWFDVSAECMACGTIVFENGVRAALQVGGPDMDIWGGVRVSGSEGFIEVMWDGQIKRAVSFNDPAWTLPADHGDTGDDQMIAMVRDVINCLETGRESEISSRAALRVTETIFAMYESVRRGARVELPISGFTDSPFLSMLASGQFQWKTT